ncbi:sigma factor [Actinomycetes bacterium KLBMP 9797]
MGRHAAGWTAPGPPDPDELGKSFERLVEPHRAALRAYILRFTEGDEAVADCVLKETLYRLVRDPRRYPRRPSAVRPWLMLTARNVVRDGERHAPAGHDDRPYPPLPDVRPPEPASQLPVSAIVGLLNDLPSMERDLIVEVVYGEVSLEAAASDRGVPVETIKYRLYSAMRALRALQDRQQAVQ